MRSDATRSTPPSSTFTPPNQRGRYSQPNLPTLLVSYNADGTPNSVSPDRRIRMSQPILNSSFSGINFVGITRGRLSYPSLRASGDNYMNFKIDEERLSAPNVRSSGLPLQPDKSHVLRREPRNKRERLSQPTLVPGDYYPGRCHQRLSQPCLSSGKDMQNILNSPVKHKRICSPPKLPQRDRLLHQLDFGTSRYSRNSTELQAVDLAKFNRDRFSIPELETANDLRLIAGTPKQRFSLDSSLNESKRRSRLLPIASSPISENLVKSDNQCDIKKAADCLESVLITSTTPLLPHVESVLDPLPVLKAGAIQAGNNNQRASVPDISTSSLRRLLDPPAKQRHSITGNLRQCLLPMAKKAKKSNGESHEGEKKKGKTNKADNLSADKYEADKKEPQINIQRHYSYTYETSNDSSSFYTVKENISVVPRKKFLESNFDRNEQVITTVIESEVPMILTSPKSLNKAIVYGSETPKWMRKYIDLENESPKIGRRNSQSSRRKAWQNSNRDSVDSFDSEKELIIGEKKNVKKDTEARPKLILKSSSIQDPADNRKGIKDTYVTIKSKNSENKFQISAADPSWMETDIYRLYGVDCEGSESDESTSI